MKVNMVLEYKHNMVEISQMFHFELLAY